MIILAMIIKVVYCDGDGVVVVMEVVGGGAWGYGKGDDGVDGDIDNVNRNLIRTGGTRVNSTEKKNNKIKNKRRPSPSFILPSSLISSLTSTPFHSPPLTLPPPPFFFPKHLSLSLPFPRT